ncbi:hypothetical protein MJO28_014574 [Puccinia striiformis f. sp. tritici]|uniref:Uncharacterized protein n=1 Tax=Puccinia striiformis f. sp. tritici TaxID=168172 RepID=A0ACC0DUB6_9BASI|nr:hypothetical protein MJO28_014574 [Puccinia striiformis f. sp. tritici]KAI7939708.1 hypothetical protein MJO29_014444 [Puccinia striiformis f. sp. tritici]
MVIGGIGSIAKAIGSIAKASLWFSTADDSPLRDLMVVHGPPEDAASSVRVRYLLSANKLDVPLNTKFTSHSRILLRENLDSPGANTGIMIVNLVTMGMYCDL